MENFISWFEIPVKDMERASAFYGSIFGIEIPTSTLGDYLMGFFPSDDINASGALVKGEGYEPAVNGTVVYLNGGVDLQNILSKVESAGGKIIVPKTEITPEFGFFAYFLDTEGNKIGLHSRS